MGPLQGMGPNKSTEREVERRKEFEAKDRVCCRGMVAPSRPPPSPPFPPLGEEDPVPAHVCARRHRKRERGLTPG